MSIKEVLHEVQFVQFHRQYIDTRIEILNIIDEIKKNGSNESLLEKIGDIKKAMNDSIRSYIIKTSERQEF